ncbi:hypothetical protein CB0940_01093 [Cercospora beticola]|uniref:Smr domain-containing protein n=1 Tax=Cercospora beticola TaxID=122368 RepID=A0A2G5IBT1_CERBT|nr:hypothetical protein CB0940_01093 [Cercospora beticola]PIB02307.1 hypothetical protein CB0940_01093 [Cercospora beticola]WPA96518.1 hypothetical protein RHO25_001125 [Cercospora beticola]
MADAYTQLEAVYCPPLDPALLSAILSDYDVNNEGQLAEAKLALDQLKESALLEEQLGFDASGTGGREDDELPTNNPGSCPGETNTTVSRETDLTSLSAGYQSLDLDSDTADESNLIANGDVAEELENLDETTKIQLLESIIDGRLSRYTVQYTLRKCHGRWHSALEELLSQIYLREAEDGESGTKLPAKGVDAFFEENTARRNRKGKARKKTQQSSRDNLTISRPATPDEPTANSSNAWQGSSRDIEFIATRTGKPSSVIATLYHKSGASRPKTIAAVLKTHLAEGTAALLEDPVKAATAHDLSQAYPSVAKDYIAALIDLSYPSTGAARELAEALTAKPPRQGGIEIIPAYVRPNFDAEAASPGPFSRRSQPGRADVLDSQNIEARERATTYAAARNAALAQAYAAHRKAKSDRLMGGVAAYYGQLSRDYYALSSGANAAAADQLAASQSNSTQLDLHGIDVLNGVRIAQEKVEQWWEGLGEARANGRIGASERQSGYHIVVGLGKHSEGGRSKLGPAVTKMLTAQGWKHEMNGAVITVRGRMQR